MAGFPKVRAQDLINNLKKQMEPFHPTICLEEAVDQVEKKQMESLNYKRIVVFIIRKRLLLQLGMARFNHEN